MALKALCILALIFVLSQAGTLKLKGTVRDFTPTTHPDFENKNEPELGIVEEYLDAYRKPVFKAGTKKTVQSKTSFDQWYNNDPINLSKDIEIELKDDDNDGIYTYDNPEFFPIDNELFKNEGRLHNYHFTFELHTKFTYEPGQTFSFTGDDDIWVFINSHLEIDLGGVHSAMSAGVHLDTLGLTPGNTYTLDIFFAERHTASSKFMIETSIELIKDPCVKKRRI